MINISIFTIWSGRNASIVDIRCSFKESGTEKNRNIYIIQWKQQQQLPKARRIMHEYLFNLVYMAIDKIVVTNNKIL